MERNIERFRMICETSSKRKVLLQLSSNFGIIREVVAYNSSIYQDTLLKYPMTPQREGNGVKSTRLGPSRTHAVSVTEQTVFPRRRIAIGEQGSQTVPRSTCQTLASHFYT
jgi:hypothetical protein